MTWSGFGASPVWSMGLWQWPLEIRGNLNYPVFRCVLRDMVVLHGRVGEMW